MQKIKVLMVDDEVQFRETTSKILTRKGFATTVAGTGEEAVEIIKKTPQDVVVLDLKMPGMSGEEALAKLKEIDPKIQVIMLTGHGDIESAKRSLKHEAFDYLSKPCDIDRLSARINDAYNISHQVRREEPMVGRVMIPLEDYTTIGPGASVLDGIQELNKSFECLLSTTRLMQTGHRSILVMDGQELLGVLAIMDLVDGLMPGYLSMAKPTTADNLSYSPMFWSGLFTHQVKDLAKKKVSDVMSPPPPSINEDANLMEAAHLLYTHGCRRLVVRRNGKVVGVLREQEIFFELAGIILNRERA